MIVVDTSVWVDHLRHGETRLVRLLEEQQAEIHPFVIGELACGNLRARQEVLALLQSLPRRDACSDEEVLFFIERHGLMGKGIGYVDAHLLAATRVVPGRRLWTRDKRLQALAAAQGLAYEEPAH
ncbi:type II toxin-antitoxin system VapC family toxin [Azohydromonas caseinilytica]|uniref:Type II toxin-antitoxin system VapC family toxin n=1 Tax=Azohydromonas caseinilytica TaxID=2728836 RepID=A0A848F9U8_9BURK|nr:type II toxin-antitoxin system VapC family toxin [Azohydromonas caseinilytica]NML15093.1 type II toxin-antitoxin system VapC family toxin [Azohydromonas caseinilytica]